MTSFRHCGLDPEFDCGARLDLRQILNRVQDDERERVLIDESWIVIDIKFGYL